MTDIQVKKLGVRFEPAALVVGYDRNGSHRKRIIPVRNLTKRSEISDILGELTKSDKHKKILNGIPSIQLMRMLSIMKDHLNGLSLDESLDKCKQTEAIDSDEDLNKADQDTLNIKKAAMDELFQQNQKKPTDPDFQYDIQVDFGSNDAVETVNWSDDDDDFGF